MCYFYMYIFICTYYVCVDLYSRYALDLVCPLETHVLKQGYGGPNCRLRECWLSTGASLSYRLVGSNLAARVEGKV